MEPYRSVRGIFHTQLNPKVLSSQARHFARAGTGYNDRGDRGRGVRSVSVRHGRQSTGGNLQPRVSNVQGISQPLARLTAPTVVLVKTLLRWTALAEKQKIA
jgi:hypothetical protein